MIFKGLLKNFRWRKFRTDRQERNQRAVAAAVRMSQDMPKARLDGTPQPPVSPEQAAAASSDASPSQPSVADFQDEVDRELDRVFEGRPREPQRGGRRIVLFTSPGGNS